MPELDDLERERSRKVQAQVKLGGILYELVLQGARVGLSGTKSSFGSSVFTLKTYMVSPTGKTFQHDDVFTLDELIGVADVRTMADAILEQIKTENGLKGFKK
jgi:hypothetical protein